MLKSAGISPMYYLYSMLARSLLLFILFMHRKHILETSLIFSVTVIQHIPDEIFITKDMFLENLIT